MKTQSQNAIIIGANLSGLNAVQALIDIFDNIILIDPRADDDLSGDEQQYLHELNMYDNLSVMLNTQVRGYLCNAKGDITGANVQALNHRLETIRSGVIISATDDRANTTRWLQCMGYEPVPYHERQIMLTVPMLHTVTVQSYRYHKIEALPRGLFIIGSALSNIAHLTGETEQIAQIQAVLLKQYLTGGQSNLKFQKNVARITAIVMKEYIYSAHHRAGIERGLETRGFATATH